MGHGVVVQVACGSPCLAIAVSPKYVPIPAATTPAPPDTSAQVRRVDSAALGGGASTSTGGRGGSGAGLAGGAGSGGGGAAGASTSASSVAVCTSPSGPTRTSMRRA